MNKAGLALLSALNFKPGMGVRTPESYSSISQFFNTLITFDKQCSFEEKEYDVQGGLYLCATKLFDRYNKTTQKERKTLV